MREAKFDRFYVEEEDFVMYNELEKDEDFPLNNHPEVFLLSACIGYKYNKREPLIKPKQLTQRSSVLGLEYAETIYDAFKYMASKNKEFDEDGNVKVKTLIEEYAKGGFKILSQQILNEPSKKSENLINYMMLHL